MGQSDQVRRHQAGVKASIFRKSRYAISEPHVCSGSKAAVTARLPEGPLRPLKADMPNSMRRVCFVPQADVSRCSNIRLQKPDLFDHLVGATEQREREGDAKRPGGLEINDQLDLGGLLDRQLSRLLAIENAASIYGSDSALRPFPPHDRSPPPERTWPDHLVLSQKCQKLT